MYLEEQLGYMELSGKAIRFATPDVTELDAMEITLEPVQDLNGYEYPWAGGCRKNLLDENLIVPGYVSASGPFVPQSDTYKEVSSDYIPITGGEAYTASVYIDNDEQKWMSIALFDANKVFITRPTRPLDYATGWITQTVTGDQTSGVAFVRVCYRSYGIAYNPQFEKGSAATAWEPYENICPITGFTGVNVYVSPTRNPKDGNTYSVTWETEAGTVYGGTLNACSGVLIADRAVFIPTENSVWVNGNANNGYRWRCSELEQKSAEYNVGVNKRLSSILPVNTDAYFDSRRTLSFITYSYSVLVRLLDSAYSTADAVRNAMKGQKFIYPLAEPIIYQLDPVTIRTLIGINNIWTDTDSTISAGFYYRKEHQPMAMNYDYCWTYPKVYIDKLEARIAALETAAADAKAAAPDTKAETEEVKTESVPEETQPEQTTKKGAK